MSFNLAAEVCNPANHQLLKPGAVSWGVRLLRRALAATGCGPAVWLDFNRGVSNIMDSELCALLRRFQAAAGLEANSVCGPETWQALAARLQPPGSAADGIAPAMPDLQAIASEAAVRERIVTLARNVERRHIREHGANRGATIELILRHAGGQAGLPWCVAFCWAVVDLAYLTLGRIPPGMDKLSCSRLVKWAQDESRLITDVAEALPGDLLVLKGGRTGYRHAAIMTALPDTAGEIPTVEGNTAAQSGTGGEGIHARLRNPCSAPCVFVRV